MLCDWKRKARAAAVAETASVLLRPRVNHGADLIMEGFRSVPNRVVFEPKAPSEAERIDRLDNAISAARPAAASDDYADVKKVVLAAARTGLAKINEGAELEQFTVAEHIALEAVIITGGERPSLLVREGFVNLHAPDIGTWAKDIRRCEQAIRKTIASVGRIDIPVDPGFAGTCFVIAEGLVMTNRHVLEEIATQVGGGNWILKWPHNTEADFAGEDGIPTPAKFKITGVAFAGPDPINRTVNFAHLDMAVLRVDRTSAPENGFPEPVTFEIDKEQPLADRDLYVVGFPGRPRTWLFGGKPPTGHETTDVISIIFNNKFGVKRVAPGLVKAGPGKVAKDDRKWICAHDASTLGGNSGSCVADLSGDGTHIVGLHFAGANRDQNWAHAVAALRDQLSNFGAKFA